VPVFERFSALAFRTVHAGWKEYDIYVWHERIPEDCVRVPGLDDPYFAQQEAERIVGDCLNQRILQNLALELPVEPTAFNVWSYDASHNLAEAFVSGRLVAVFTPEPPIPELVPLRQDEPEEETAARSDEPFRCSVQVVLDATGEPLEGIALTLRLADGTEVDVKTDAEGRAELDDAYKGKFGVTSVILDATIDETLAFVNSGATPATEATGDVDEEGETPKGNWLAHIKMYKVRTGDTLDTIAEAHNLSSDRLAYFNWGTTDPDKINAMLYLEVGCRPAKEGEPWVFDDSNKPGIILVPQPFVANGLAHDLVYTIRVQPVGASFNFLFSM
jgi:hypothetical protein